MKKINVGTVKTQAAGRWVEIFSTLGGCPPEILDGRNRPCPKCGGTDQFRVIDREAGTLFCNQCFNEKNGDGLASLSWLRGWDFATTLTQLVQYIGANKRQKDSGNGSSKISAAAKSKKKWVKNTAPCTTRVRTMSQATSLIDLTTDCQKWHSPDGVGYISAMVGQHREHWPIKSSSFRRWLQREYFRKSRAVANAQAIQDAIGTLEGESLFNGMEYPVQIRLAASDGRIYVDLVDAAWSVVEISPTGWQVLKDSPVKFRRCKAMLPLPRPVPGGDVGELRTQLGVREEGWPLLAGWQLAALRPIGPYPVLNLYAEQGAGKTTLARKLKMLVDPNTAPMRSEPRDPRDLMIAANNGWVVAFDNLSHLLPWLSDALCRLSTGGGFSTRTLYENDEETIFDAMRPIILTGIEELATRGDLIDRSLIVTLPSIPEDQRRSEEAIWQEFNEARPRLLGVLFDAVSVALRNLPKTTLPRLPRMADFAIWATAGETTLGMHVGTFMASYTGNRSEANELAIDASIIGKVLLEFTASTSYWTGTPSGLLEELNKLASDQTKRQRGWPTSGRGISNALKRLIPNLRELGVEVEMGRTNKGRFLTLTRKVGENCVTSVTTNTHPENPKEFVVRGDARVTLGDERVTQENPGNDVGDDGDDEIPPCSVEVEAGLSPEDAAAVEEFLRS